MGKMPNTERVRGVRTFCHRFEETADYQIIDISHNGYVYLEDPIYHRRRVIRLPEDVDVIDDQVTGLGLSEHDIRLYFNFAFGELADNGDGRFTYTSQKQRKYDVISKASKAVSHEILEGCEDPIGGWISYGYAWRKAIPQLAVKSDGPVPIHFITVIKPCDTTTDIQVAMETAEVSLAGGKKLVLGIDEITLS